MIQLDIVTVFSATAREMITAAILNYRFIPFYIIIIILIKMQHEKHLDILTVLYDKRKKKVRRILKETVFFGAVAGFFTGAALIFLGAEFTHVSFEYMMTIMAILLLLNIRFVCVAYSAGILALASLVFKMPHIYPRALFLLISIMHFFESLMIYKLSENNYEPVYLRHGNGIAGAFITKAIWPVPVVFMVSLTGLAGVVIFNTITLNHGTMFTPPGREFPALMGLGCAVSILSFNDIAITETPEKKSKVMALCYLIYALIMFAFALLSKYSPLFAYGGSIFAITAHEGIYLVNRSIQLKGKPLFIPVKRGVRILDVVKNGNGYKLNIRRGDILLTVNNMDVQTEEGIGEALRKAPNYVFIKYIDTRGREMKSEYSFFPDGINSLDIITVPRENEVTYNIGYYEKHSILNDLVKRFKKQ